MADDEYVEREVVFEPIPDSSILAHLSAVFSHNKKVTDAKQKADDLEARKSGWRSGYQWAVNQSSYYALKERAEAPKDGMSLRDQGFRDACAYIFKRLEIE